jgi:hypothetical protein
MYLEYLCRTHLFDSPRRALIILNLFRLPFIQIFFFIGLRYVTYREQNRASGRQGLAASIGMLRQALGDGMNRLCQALYYRVIKGTTVENIEAQDYFSRCQQAGLFPVSKVKDRLPDSIWTGENWFRPEAVNNELFCWATNDPEIIITTPTGKFDSLTLVLESGPGFDGEKVELQALDQTGNSLKKFSLWGRQSLTLPLPQITGRDCVITLHTPQHPKPIRSDSRLLGFRVHEITMGSQSRLGFVENLPIQVQRLRRWEEIRKNTNKGAFKQLPIIGPYARLAARLLKLGRMNQAQMELDNMIAEKIINDHERIGKLEKSINTWLDQHINP